MSVRKHRRAVIAELLLFADPVIIRVNSDDGTIGIDFDSISELRSWLGKAGLETPDLLTSGPRDNVVEGQLQRSMSVYPSWHGWQIYANAVEALDPVPLPTQVAAQLAAMAVNE